MSCEGNGGAVWTFVAMGADKSGDLPKGVEGSHYAVPTASSSGESATAGTGQSQFIWGTGMLPVALAGLWLLAALASRLVRHRRVCSIDTHHIVKM